MRRRTVPLHPDEAEMIAILRRADPLAGRSLALTSGPSLDARVEAIAVGVLAAQGVVRRRRRWGGIAGIIGLVVGGGTIGYALARRDVEVDPITVTCYREASFSSAAVVLGGFPAGRPVEACAAAWNDPTFADVPAPHLVACVAASGKVDVFPSDDAGVCQRLGLGSLPLTVSTDEAALSQFADSLTSRLGLAGCIDEARLREIVTEELAAANLDGFTFVTTGAASADRPCAVEGIDVASRTIPIIFASNFFSTSTPPDATSSTASPSPTDPPGT
ncbi:MAG: hypothetical protein JWL72_3303 [Ilumatobacteraceae bacterium]|nr:hypothetical protein [Ilumatobacteraceae bacterium]